MTIANAPSSPDRKREEARQQYEDAKRAGKSASLLEQQRPNVFQMNVANIMPGDEIKVEMEYNELLVPTDGVYEFAYPTVVGPRYSNQPARRSPTDKWVRQPYTCEGEKPMYTFDIKVNLAAGMPIQDVTCNSHDVDIQLQTKDTAAVRLAGSTRAVATRTSSSSTASRREVETACSCTRALTRRRTSSCSWPTAERAQIRKIMPRE